jgi:Flp pilus assembly protein TadD
MRVLLAVLPVLFTLTLQAQELEDATAKLRAGDRDGAIKILQSLSAKNPDDLKSVALLAEVLLHSGRIDEADSAISAAISRNPNASHLHSTLGDVRFREGQINLAEAEYKTAFKLDQKNPRALFGVARIFQAAAINHKADLLIREAYGLNPSDEQIEAALEEVEKQTAASIARWEKTLSELPSTDNSGIVRALTARIAEARKLGNNQPFELTTPYGHYQIPLNYLMDGRRFIVRVSEKGTVGEAGGLLGTDVFQRFLIKLDFFNKRIDLDPLPGPAWDGHTPVDRYTGPELNDFAQFYRIAHYILLPTRISDGPPVLFLVDTGAGLNSISTNAAPNITRLRDDSRLKVKGISGKVANVYSADKVVLQFANFRQPIEDMTAFDLTRFSRGAGAEITGIMGVPLLLRFRSVTLDYRDGRVKFEYKP